MPGSRLIAGRILYFVEGRDQIVSVQERNTSTAQDTSAGRASTTVASQGGISVAHSDAPRLYRRFARLIAISDALCFVGALVLSYFLRYGVAPNRADYLGVLAAAPILWILVFRGFSLYSIRHLSAWEEFRRLIGATSLGLVLVILLSYWSQDPISRAWIGLTWVIALVFILGTRHLWRSHIATLKQRGTLLMRTLIVGTNDEARRLARELEDPITGFQTVGHLASSHPYIGSNGTEAIGTLDDLVATIHDFAIECVFVATSDAVESDILSIAKEARQQGVEVRVTANLPDILSPRLAVQPIGNIMALSIRPVTLSRSQTLAKRSFDLVSSAIGLVVIAPLLLLIAATIKVTSRGPVFYRQHRITKGGHVFNMYKFRTMKSEADEILEQTGADTSEPFFKLEEDPRLTRMGAFLRRFSLDELPQLLNVLKGEMSLVGPRPLPAEQVAANLDLLGPRHEVPAGCTGWWQVHGRSDLDAQQAVKLDLFYIENWSLWLDVYILLKTAGAVVTGQGAK